MPTSSEKKIKDNDALFCFSLGDFSSLLPHHQNIPRDTLRYEN